MLPMLPADSTAAPFISQIEVLPLLSRKSRSLLPSPLKSPILHRPHGGDIPNGCAGGHGRTIHEPNRCIAQIVAPQDIGLAVAVEIAGADNVQVAMGALPSPADATTVVAFINHTATLPLCLATGGRRCRHR